jgi:hypothetical protein
VEFVKDEKFKWWETKVIFKKLPIKLTIDEDYAENECESVAIQLLAKIEGAWQQIEENLIRSLHELYNNSWIDPEIGELDTKEFLDRIPLLVVELMNEGGISLYFDGYKLFCGHGIEIFWDSDGEMSDADIFG